MVPWHRRDGVDQGELHSFGPVLKGGSGFDRKNSKGISRGLVTNFPYRIFISFLVSLDHILKIEGGSTLRFDGESIVF